MTVGLCLVSHSAEVAQGAAAMARQMAGDTVRVASAGGNADGGLGTDVGAIMAAIEAVMGPSGVAVLFDLGGAETNAEMAAELIGDSGGPIRLCQGPIVEGAVAAAAEASGGGDLDAVEKAIDGLLTAWREEPAVVGGPQSAPSDAIHYSSGSVTIHHPGGLHARPSVKVVQTAKKSGADCWIGYGERWARAESLSAVLGLKAPDGADLSFRCAGPTGERAVRQLVAVIEALPRRADTPPPPADVSVAPGAPRTAASGLVIGPIWTEDKSVVVPTPLGDRAAEVERFAVALSMAGEALADLVGGSKGQAADILSFQQGLLDDEQLLHPITVAIDAGKPAAEAWLEAMNALVEEYSGANDAYFRARASDIEDLRDRVLAAMTGGADRAGAALLEIPEGAIVLVDDMTPSRFLGLDWSRLGGLALLRGSVAGHVAILAVARNVPMVVGLGKVDTPKDRSLPAILDADNARIIVEPDGETLDRYRQRLAETRRREAEIEARVGEPARARDGRSIQVLVNVDDPAGLENLPAGNCDGIGLARTEFLSRGETPPHEDAQLEIYRRMVAWAAGRLVTIRTLDIGGDKPIVGLTPENERNPFLGVRGLRLSLQRPDVFRVQARALARLAAEAANLRVMVPMVSKPEEMASAREIFRDVVRELTEEGIAAAVPSLGMMVEVPSAALCADRFDIDFISIGTNDLVQYTLAAARDEPGVAALYDPLDPAVLKLIRMVVDHGRAAGIPVSVCGDMGAHASQLRALLDCGVTSVSVAIGALARAKDTISQWPAVALQSKTAG